MASSPAKVASTLRRLRYQNVRRFILGNATRGLLQSAGSKPPLDQVNEDNVPILNLGFELGHVLMDAYVPIRNGWHEVFGVAGWRWVNIAVIFESEPAD